jgi:GxxExxY protein
MDRQDAKDARIGRSPPVRWTRWRPRSCEPPTAVAYKDRSVGEMRPDFPVAERLIVELQTVDPVAPVHLAQALSYLEATRLRLALVINFSVPVLLRGVRRVVLFAPPSL